MIKHYPYFMCYMTCWQEVSRVKEELARLQEEERTAMEHELAATRTRQQAVNDMEKGVRTVV